MDSPLSPGSQSSRGTALKLGVVALASAVAGGAVGNRGSAAEKAPSGAQDVEILNYALLLEHLQAEFYEQALAHASLKGELREFAEIVGTHERDHVAFLEKALGPRAKSKPSFNFDQAIRTSRTFGALAVVLEDAGVAAYNGEASNLTRENLAAAAEIVSVEGRHAAWIRDIVGAPPAPRAADAGKSAQAVVAHLRSMKLVSAHG
jgi:hypothetical protein